MSWTITPRFTQWTPALISTALWLDAADAGTVTTVSGAVSQWNDKSGNARHCSQSNASLRPIYETSQINSKNTVGFNILSAAGQCLDGISAAAFSLTNHSLFIVSENVATVANSGIFSVVPATGEDWARSDAYTLNTGANGGNTTFTAQGGGFQISLGSVALNVYAFVKEGGQGIAYRSGLRVATATGTLSATSGRGYVVGCRITSGAIGSPYMRGRIAEVLCIEASVTGETRERIEGYLAHKWGFASALPSTHSFRNSAP